MTVYVLTHEYSDKSGFSVHGVTSNYQVAVAWKAGDHQNGENRVYPTQLDADVGKLEAWE